MTRFVFTRNLLMVATFLSFASEDVHGMVLPWKKGVIGPCTDYRCNFGAMCIVKNGQPSCECPRCSDEFEPVCGTDFISYQNECRLKQMSCEQRKEVYIKYKDICANEPTQAPMFTQKPDRLLRVVETQDAELRCRSFGIPKPVITWAKDGQLLSGDRYIFLGNGDLRIKSVRHSDQGVYTCIAANKIGDISSEGQLDVVNG